MRLAQGSMADTRSKSKLYDPRLLKPIASSYTDEIIADLDRAIF